AGRLETALRACLADRPDSEDEVRSKERADPGSRDVSRLKIDHGSLTEGYEAPRVHHASRRRGGSVAARGTRAATGEPYRVLGCEHAIGREQMDRRFRAAAS